MSRRDRDVPRDEALDAIFKRGVQAPDLTDPILEAIHGRREFLPRRRRLFVSGGRLATAACLLLALMSVALTHRYWPGVEAVAGADSEPVTALLKTTAHETGRGLEAIESRLTAVVDTGREYVDEIRGAVDRSCQRPSKIRSRCVIASIHAPARDLNLTMERACAVPMGAGEPVIERVAMDVFVEAHAPPSAGRRPGVALWAAEDYFASRWPAHGRGRPELP